MEFQIWNTLYGIWNTTWNTSWFSLLCCFIKDVGLLPIKMGGKTSLTPEAEVLNFKKLLSFHSHLLIYVSITNILCRIWSRHSRGFEKYSCVFSVAPLCIVKLPPTLTKSADINQSFVVTFRRFCIRPWNCTWKIQLRMKSLFLWS